MWQLLFLSVYFSQRCRSTVTYFFFCLLHLCYQLIISNYAALLHSSFYSVEDFSVQTCSKCLQWMPEELFQTRTVENKTVSVQRDLLTFKSHTSDIKNPRTFQVNTDFLISKIKELFYDVSALQRPTDRPAEGWISQGSAALLQGGTDLRLTPNVWPAVWRTARTWCCCSPAARRPVSVVRGSSLGRETLRSAIVSYWGDLGKHSLGCSSLE